VEIVLRDDIEGVPSQDGPHIMKFFEDREIVESTYSPPVSTHLRSFSIPASNTLSNVIFSMPAKIALTASTSASSSGNCYPAKSCLRWPKRSKPEGAKSGEERG
jgi:hypothetical protein